MDPLLDVACESLSWTPFFDPLLDTRVSGPALTNIITLTTLITLVTLVTLSPNNPNKSRRL